MRLWLVLVVGGLLLLALWGLPPRTDAEWFGGYRYGGADAAPERLAHREIMGALTEAHWRYQRLGWKDSIRSLALSAGREGPLWRGAVPEWASDSLGAELTDALRRQLEAVEALPPRIPVGTVLMDGREDMRPAEAKRASSFNEGILGELFVGSDPAAPFCFFVSPVDRPLVREPVWRRMIRTPGGASVVPNPLGPCALHARFGSPGPEVSRWLRRGGYRLGFLTLEAPHRAEGPEPWTRRGAFGTRGRWYAGFMLSPVAEKCLAGDVDACRRAVLSPPGPTRTMWLPAPHDVSDNTAFPVAFRFSRHSYTVEAIFAGREISLLHDLARAFGPGAFEAFWTSNLPVEDAFRDAFGLPLGQWVLDWATERLGKRDPRPTVPMQATLLSGMAALLLAGAALFLGRKRG
jgi:hypothetical protein